MYTNPEQTSNLVQVDAEQFEQFKKKMLFKSLTEENFKQWRNSAENDQAVGLWYDKWVEFFMDSSMTLKQLKMNAPAIKKNKDLCHDSSGSEESQQTVV